MFKMVTNLVVMLGFLLLQHTESDLPLCITSVTLLKLKKQHQCKNGVMQWTDCYFGKECFLSSLTGQQIVPFPLINGLSHCDTDHLQDYCICFKCNLFYLRSNRVSKWKLQLVQHAVAHILKTKTDWNIAHLVIHRLTTGPHSSLNQTKSITTNIHSP